MASVQFKCRNYIKNNECCFILPNNVLINKKRVENIYGVYLTDLKFLCYHKLNELDLTEIEIAILHPILLLSCDGIYFN